jgi:hypothetical protein
MAPQTSGNSCDNRLLSIWHIWPFEQSTLSLIHVWFVSDMQRKFGQGPTQVSLLAATPRHSPQTPAPARKDAAAIPKHNETHAAE